MEIKLTLTPSEVVSLETALRMELRAIKDYDGEYYNKQRAEVEAILEKLKK